MHYEFPRDLTLDEVRDVVAAHNKALDVAAFIEADRVNHTIFNYVVAFDGSFPDVTSREAAILRECRGIVFAKDGRLLSRRFHKFFNVNQKAETQAHVIDWSRPHRILEKLDGSMITPLHLDGEVFWGTKMGLTDVALPVEEFVSRNPRYRDFALDEFAEGRTPIFEWCSLKQKIVIAYPEDRLILTAVRDNATGLYLSHDELLALGDRWGVPVVRALPGSVENIQTFLDEAYGLKGEEGYVIVFDDGHKVKVKAEEYCMIHNTKDTLQREKDVLAMIYSDKIDDLLPMMDPDDRVIVDRFMRDLEHEIAKTAAGLREIVEEARTRYPDKRSFATQFMPTWPNAMTKPFLFSIYDGIDPVEIVRRHVAKKVYSATQVEEARPLVGGLRWFDYYRTKFEGGD